MYLVIEFKKKKKQLQISAARGRIERAVPPGDHPLLGVDLLDERLPTQLARIADLERLDRTDVLGLEEGEELRLAAGVDHALLDRARQLRDRVDEDEGLVGQVVEEVAEAEEVEAGRGERDEGGERGDVELVAALLQHYSLALLVDDQLHVVAALQLEEIQLSQDLCVDGQSEA